MAEYHDREHYIPIRKADLEDLLCKQQGMPAADQQNFRKLCQMIEATFHFEYHKELEALKNAYAPFDPDADTRTIKQLNPSERTEAQESVFDNFTNLLEKANYTRLTRADIEKALEGSSDWGINMSVDFDVFERYEFFVRGDGIDKRSRRRMVKLWRLETVELPTYQRMVLIMKLKQHKRLGSGVNTDAIFIKIFKDIPKMDLEMLLPGARVQMTRLDKALIIYPLAAGLGLLLYQIGATVWQSIAGGAALALVGALGALGWGAATAAGGYGYKSYYSYSIKKQTYQLQLAQSLYYQNLDSNAGCLFRLLDEAEEQECREAMLGYYYLWRKPREGGWTAADLDDFIEMELEGKANVKVDFEIEDALDKLKRLKMIQELPGGKLQALPIAKALENLDFAWDNYFQYNKG